MEMKKVWLYLDDVRTPTDPNWTVVRDYNEFIARVRLIGLDGIEVISLDHDLGSSAMAEYFTNVKHNYKLDYDNITEKTGYDCAKWLVSHHMDNPKAKFPTVYVHSANPIGSANIMGYVNNYYMNSGLPQTCVRIRVDHTVEM
jgi:hypothetical protein